MITLPRKENVLRVRIGEVKQRDIGKKRTRLDLQLMENLKVVSGDIIEITGCRSSYAIAWPAYEDEKLKNIIRMDGQTRKNVGLSLNDIVKIKKALVKTAKTVVLSPTNDIVTIDKEFTDFVKNRLKGLPLTQDDDISVMITPDLK